MPTLEYMAPILADLYRRAEIRPEYEALAFQTANRLYQNTSRYIALCDDNPVIKRVPPVFVMCLHERESSGAFNTYLGNGDPISRPTVNVPKGRGGFPDFEAGAIDALVYDGLHLVQTWGVPMLAYYMISFNGWGYYQYHGIVASPYAFAGSTVQVPGKYVADEKFDPTVMDPQLGGMLVYNQLVQLDPGLALPL